MMRASMSGPGVGHAIYSGIDQEPIPSHVQSVPGIGDGLFHHACAVNVASISTDGAAERIALIVATEGCNCGCAGRGRGLLLTPDAEGARKIAAQLIAMAEKVEAQATELVTAALAKARGK